MDFSSGPGIPIPTAGPDNAQPEVVTAVPAAGWYPDRQGQAAWRYWDGKDWSDQTSGVPPTASLLLYLYADQVLQKHGGLGVTHVPCNRGSVRINELAGLLLAVAFWHLGEQGLATLEEATENRTLAPDERTVRVTRVADGERPGLEGQLLARLAPGAGSSAGAVARDITGRRGSTAGRVLVPVLEEARAIGLASWGGDGPPQSLGVVGYDCEHIAAMWELCAPVVEAWRSFATPQNALCARLLKVCRDSLFDPTASGGMDRSW